jgi:stringent starvation protein B
MGRQMSDAPRQPPPKREVALALLEESSMFIHLDPRRPNVLVPKGFLTQHQLVLQVGLNMAIPIPDLTIDEAGISCTLSFNRAPFWCRIPWTAIYALVGEDGRGGVWPEEVPPEIQQQKQGMAPAKGPGSKRPRPKLAAVSSTRMGGKEDRSLDDLSDPSGQDGGGPPDLAEAEPAADAESYGSNAAEDRSHQRSPEPARAALTSVPRVSQPRAVQDASAEDEGAGEAAPTQVPAAAPAPTAPGKKAKREIPPYLRVIK